MHALCFYVQASQYADGSAHVLLDLCGFDVYSSPAGERHRSLPIKLSYQSRLGTALRPAASLACDELVASVVLKDSGTRSMFLSTHPSTVYFTFPA